MSYKRRLINVVLLGMLSVYQTEAYDDIDAEEELEIKAEKSEEAEEPAEHQLYDFYDILTLQKGSQATFGTGLFRSTSGIVNYTDDVKLRPNSTLTLQAGDGINTGVFHNYGRFELYKNSKITGGGTIFEHGQFGNDEVNTDRASREKTEEGYVADDGYIIPGYDTQRDLTTSEELQNAAYYDLVNNEDAPIQNFKICYTDYGTNYYTGCGIFTTSKELGDPSIQETDFVKITNSMRGTGDQGKVDSSIIFKTDTPEFNQITDSLDTAYDLKKLAQDYGSFESIHSSDQTDDIKSSFFSIHGFDTEEAGHDREGLDGSTYFKFGENLDKEVWIPKVDDKVVLGKTMPDTEKATEYEQDIMDTINTSADDKSNLFAYKDWEENDPVTTYHGDNSWFNGVYKLKRGAIIVKNTAGMFGGRVELGDADGYESSIRTGTGTLALHSDLVAGNEGAKDFIKGVRPTEFEWEGGSKDEYNKPDIYMNGNSTLFFNLQPDQDGNQIFSFYGNITGTERDRLIFEQGEVRIKGDCSGFKGSIAVTPGAKFEVRSSDAGSSSTYQGKFPNANIYQVYGADAGENAGKFVTNPTAVTSVDTATMENVTINNGIMELNNGGSEAGGKITLKSANIENTAMTTLNDESEIKDTVIRGVLVAKGDMTVENTTLEGGVLVLDNATLTTDNMTAGSTIASWGNDNWNDVVRIGGAGGAGGHFQINQHHTLKLFSDYNVTTGASDYINVVNPVANIQTAGGIAVAGMNFNDIPTNDTYTFKIYDGAGHTDNMPVTIGGSYNGGDPVFDVYVNGTFNPTNTNPINGINAAGIDDVGDTKLNYNVTNNEQKVTTYLDNGVRILEFNNGNLYKVEGQSAGRYGNVVLTKTLTDTAVVADVVQSGAISTIALNIGDTLSDTDDILNSSICANSEFSALNSILTTRGTSGSTSTTNAESKTAKHNSNNALPLTERKTKKYRIWNKTFGEHSTIDLQGSSNMSMNEAGTMVGFDVEDMKFNAFGYEAMLRPTVFVGLQHNNLRYKGDKYGINGYFGGAKVSLYNKNQVLEMFGIYEQFNSRATLPVNYSESQKIKVKSHVFNLGAKYAINFKLNQNLYVRPDISLGYAFMCSPAFNGYNGARHKLRNRHMLAVAPGVSLVRRQGDWLIRGFMAYHRKFGTRGRTKATGVSMKTDFTKKRFVEYGAEITKINLTNNTSASVKLSRKTFGVRGFKATISVGIKF